eukprot:Rhum_TRINITY_DN9442_c0_g1::Rhum_TRINITY_DN9442_c0_g1_i1::g.33255::m.33255
MLVAVDQVLVLVQVPPAPEAADHAAHDQQQRADAERRRAHPIVLVARLLLRRRGPAARQRRQRARARHAPLVLHVAVRQRLSARRAVGQHRVALARCEVALLRHARPEGAHPAQAPLRQDGVEVSRRQRVHCAVDHDRREGRSRRQRADVHRRPHGVVAHRAHADGHGAVRERVEPVALKRAVGARRDQRPLLARRRHARPPACDDVIEEALALVARTQERPPPRSRRPGRRRVHARRGHVAHVRPVLQRARLAPAKDTPGQARRARQDGCSGLVRRWRRQEGGGHGEEVDGAGRALLRLLPPQAHVTEAQHRHALRVQHGTGGQGGHRRGGHTGCGRPATAVPTGELRQAATRQGALAVVGLHALGQETGAVRSGRGPRVAPDGREDGVRRALVGVEAEPAIRVGGCGLLRRCWCHAEPREREQTQPQATTPPGRNLRHQGSRTARRRCGRDHGGGATGAPDNKHPMKYRYCSF